MKIYQASLPFDSNDSPMFRVPKYAVGGAVAFRNAYNSGSTISLDWIEDGGGLREGDAVRFPLLALCVRKNVAEKIADLTPRGEWMDVEIGGVPSYVVLKPVNYENEMETRDHVFLMFRKHKKLLVSDMFRKRWIELGFTGLDFVECDDLPDECFVRPG